MHDIARPNLNVFIGIDRAGLVGADGETHQGVFDIAFLRHIPNMTIMMPKDENEGQHMVKQRLIMMVVQLHFVIHVVMELVYH